MSNENITNCISVDENGKVVNITRGLDYTSNSTCVDMTDEFKYVQIGDTMKGEIVPLDSEAGRLHNLFTIIDPEWVKKPLTPEELKQNWYMEKRELEKEIREVQFQIMFDNAMGLADKLQKDKEIYYALDAKLKELIANEPQG